MTQTICDNIIPFMFPYLKWFRRRRDLNNGQCKAHNHQTLFTIDFFLKWAQVGKSHSPIVWPCQTLLLWNYNPKTDTWRNGAVSIRPLLDMFAIFQTFKPERQISKQTYSTTLPSGEFMKLISRQIATVEKQSRNLQYSSELILGYPWLYSV